MDQMSWMNACTILMMNPQRESNYQLQSKWQMAEFYALVYLYVQTFTLSEYGKKILDIKFQ